MQRHEVHYLPVAEEDLSEIVDYLSEYSINAANKFIDELENLEESLSVFPELGTLSRDKRLKSKGYRMLAISEYFNTIRKCQPLLRRGWHFECVCFS